MDIDPRDQPPQDPNDVLTEDSDDELADLEKEFEARKARLLAERENKKKKTEQAVQVRRSPSPDRVREVAHKSVQVFSKESPRFKTTIENSSTTIPIPKEQFKGFKRALTSSFAKKLHGIELIAKSTVANYNERYFEFENVPKRTIIQCDADNTLDGISGEILLRRYLAEPFVDQMMVNIKVLRITKLLAKVYPPKFEEPQYVNWCLTGIIMHKSDPKITSTNSKYMCLRVGLFAHTVDVMLFGDAFKRYWKLQCGDIIAILNPNVKKYGNNFNLSLTDDLQSILEIGTLKNYNRCSATTAEGTRCKFVVDLLKNELCSYHEEAKFKQRSRMELQGSIKPKAPQDKNGNTSQMYFNKTSNKPLYVGFESAGIQEKDMIYSGGEQFDETKYDRPIIESLAAKLRKQKANQRLRLQLLIRAVPARVEVLQKLGIVGSEEYGMKPDIQDLLRLQAYHRGFVKGIGYDPVAAARSSTSSTSSPQNFSSSSAAIQELRQLSSGKKASLGPSRQEKSAKLQKRQKALHIIDGTLPARNKRPMKNPLNPKRRRTDITILDENNSCESESDIEISFANEADRSQYKTVCMPSQPGVNSEVDA